MDADGIYRELGKFIVCFQSLENILEQIAWRIIDPEWEDDPRKQTAELWFKALLELVQKEYIQYIDSYEIDDAEDRKKRFAHMIDQCHELAVYRNRLVHSTYVHLEGGGELRGILRSDLGVENLKDCSSALTFDQELLDEHSFEKTLVKMAELAFQLNLVHVQLIHWHGFIPKKELPPSGT